MEEKQILLEAENLVKEFPARRGKVHAVSDVSLCIYRGETLALVGESGCGKSTLGRMLLRLIEPTSGRLRYDGRNLLALKPEKMREMRRRMQIIFQDPYASLNPRMSIGRIIEEPLLTHKIGENRQERQSIVHSLMDKVGIRPEFYSRYPHQFSGGQRQRVGIARALALNPELIVCDEPVSALDVSIQAQILNLLRDLQKELGLTYLFISHDLGVVRYISDRVCVMFLGRLCEIGGTKEALPKPHPPLYQIFDGIRSQAGSRFAKRRAGDSDGGYPKPHRSAFGLPLSYALPICQGDLQQGGTAHAGIWKRPVCGLPFSAGPAPKRRIAKAAQQPRRKGAFDGSANADCAAEHAG